MNEMEESVQRIRQIIKRNEVDISQVSSDELADSLSQDNSALNTILLHLKEKLSKQEVTLQEMKDILKNSDHEGFMDIYENGENEEVSEYVKEYLKNSYFYKLSNSRG